VRSWFPGRVDAITIQERIKISLAPSPQRDWKDAMGNPSQAKGQPADPKGTPLRLALVWRGNPEVPDQPTKHRARLQPLIDALTEAGTEIEPVVYFDHAIDAARGWALADPAFGATVSALLTSAVLTVGAATIASRGVRKP